MISITHREQDLPSADVFVHNYTLTADGQMCTLAHIDARGIFSYFFILLVVQLAFFKQTKSLRLHEKQEKCHYF